MSSQFSVRRILSAQAFEAMAAGLMMSMAIVYFAIITDVPVAAIGLVSAAAGLASLPLGIFGGWLCDRFGSRTALIINNLLGVIGYTRFLFAHSAATIFIALLLVSVGDRVYWAIWTTFIKDLAGDGLYEETFAKFEALKMAVMGFGAATSAVVLGFAAATGARWIVLGNIALTLIAAAIYQSVKPSAQPLHTVAAAREESMRWWHVTRHRGFWPIVIGQFFLAPIMVLPNVALSAYFVTVWGMSAAVASVMFGVNAAVVAIFQQASTKALRSIPRSALISLAGLLLIAALAALALMPELRGIQAWAFVVLIAIVLGAGDILYIPATNALMVELPPAQVRGVSVSIFQTVMAVGMAIYPASLALLSINPLLLWIVTATSIAAGAIAYRVAAQRGPTSPRAAPIAAPDVASM